MNRIQGAFCLLACVVSWWVFAVPKGDPHILKANKGGGRVQPPTLRDVLELESWVIDKNPSLLGEADRLKRAQALSPLLPTIGTDSTVPDGVRQRLAALDGQAASLMLEGTAQVRDGWAGQLLASGDTSPRASARAEMRNAVAQNNVEIVDPTKTVERWALAQGSGTRTQARQKNTERGIYDSLPKKETF